MPSGHEPQRIPVRLYRHCASCSRWSKYCWYHCSSLKDIYQRPSRLCCAIQNCQPRNCSPCRLDFLTTNWTVIYVRDLAALAWKLSTFVQRWHFSKSKRTHQKFNVNSCWNKSVNVLLNTSVISSKVQLCIMFVSPSWVNCVSKVVSGNVYSFNEITDIDGSCSTCACRDCAWNWTLHLTHHMKRAGNILSRKDGFISVFIAVKHVSFYFLEANMLRIGRYGWRLVYWNIPLVLECLITPFDWQQITIVERPTKDVVATFGSSVILTVTLIVSKREGLYLTSGEYWYRNT